MALVKIRAGFSRLGFLSFLDDRIEISRDTPLDVMMLFGGGIYAAGLVILLMLWRRTSGRSLEELCEESRVEHHSLIEILNVHPRGGRWRDFQSWLKLSGRGQCE